MKKLLALLLAVLMVLSVTACSEDDDKKSRKKDKTTQSEKIDKEDVEPDDTDVDIDVDDEVKELEQAEDFCLGTIDGRVYENEFIGIGYKADLYWTYMTESEIQQINNFVTDNAGDYKEAMQAAQVYTDMFVGNIDSSENININLEKVSDTVLDAIDDCTYYENTIESFENLYKSYGCTDFDYEITTLTIDGVDFHSMNLEVEIDGTMIYQTVFVVRCNGYASNVTCTSRSADALTDMIEKFYLL